MGDLSTTAVVLDGGPLSLDAVAAVARAGARVELAPKALAAVERSRAFVERRGAGEQLVAIELRRAAHALDGRAPLTPGRGSAAARDAVRRAIRPLDTDRYLKADLDAALAVAESGAVLAAVEAAIGALG